MLQGLALKGSLWRFPFNANKKSDNPRDCPILVKIVMKICIII